MKRICVYCGSNSGTMPEYLQAAKQLGNLLVEKDIGLVYGGASIGIMGEIANAVTGQGGEVIGVIPRTIAEKRNITFTGLSDLRVVGTMHERKALMSELSDGFIAMPGGFGTFEEFFEILTWAQLGLHKKPCGVLNVCQYYDKLMAFLQHATDNQFIKKEHCSMVLVDEHPEMLLEKFREYQPLKTGKWIQLPEE